MGNLNAREIGLFSIGGWYEEPNARGHGIKGKVGFGGFFLFDFRKNAFYEGHLTDLFGSATIEGVMTEEDLSFTKLYTTRNKDRAIDYNFKKQNGIWIGEYKSPAFDRPFSAKAVTTLVEEDVLLVL